MNGATPLLNTFSRSCRERYGEPVGKLVLDMGVVCPNREKGGCIYCRADGFTPGYLRQPIPIETQVERGKSRFLANRFRRYYCYFQQETCTAVPENQFYDTCYRLLLDPDCCGLIISTRPDALPDTVLGGLDDLQQRFHKDIQIEIGLQSIHDKSLRLLNRNHSYADFLAAVERVCQAGRFPITVHLILGIPEESEEEMMASVFTVCDLDICGLKLHHLQVVEGTRLAEMYRNGLVEVWTRQGYLQLLLKLIPHIPAGIVLHRLWATCHPDMLIAPKWNVLSYQLRKELQDAMHAAGLYQGCGIEQVRRRSRTPG